MVCGVMRSQPMGEAMTTLAELAAWAVKCRSAAKSEPDPNAKAAYEGLAAEFEAVEAEIEGLMASFEALEARRVGHQVAVA